MGVLSQADVRRLGYSVRRAVADMRMCPQTILPERQRNRVRRCAQR